MNEQQKLWSSEFGDQYQERNKLTDEEIGVRKNLWENVLRTIYMNSGYVPQSILEIGAGQGPNLVALKQIYDNMYTEAIKIKPQEKKEIPLWATEINQKAQEQLKENVPGVHILDKLNGIQNVADLVFTYGVLIHTHPAHLKALMDDIYKASKRFIVCAEYFAPESRMIEYHGTSNSLWLDDYGSKWINNYPLRVIGYAFLWKPQTKCDNITLFMLEKVEKMN